MLANIDPEKIADLLRECARTLILPRHNKLAKHEIDTKSGPTDLVTIADRESEEFLKKQIESLYSGSVVIGEESVATDPACIDILNDQDKIVWVVDPVDGTSNFVAGNSTFAVMVACVFNGETQFGWIYDPLGNRMMIATKDKGVTINGQPVYTAAPKPLNEAIGHALPKYFPSLMRPSLENLKANVKDLYSMNCSGHEYLSIVSGRTDFMICKNTKPWDHLAGVLAVREAGGQANRWDGSVFDAVAATGGLVISANPRIYQDLMATVVPDLYSELKPSV